MYKISRNLKIPRSIQLPEEKLIKIIALSIILYELSRESLPSGMREPLLSQSTQNVDQTSKRSGFHGVSSCRQTSRSNWTPGSGYVRGYRFKCKCCWREMKSKWSSRSHRPVGTGIRDNVSISGNTPELRRNVSRNSSGRLYDDPCADAPTRETAYLLPFVPALPFSNALEATNASVTPASTSEGKLAGWRLWKVSLLSAISQGTFNRTFDSNKTE